MRMKKIGMAMLVAMFVFTNASAQKMQGVKHFLGSCKYEIVAGYGGTNVTEPFDEAKFGFNVGATARKGFKSFMDEKLDAYGLVGILYTRRAGKMDNDFMTLGDDNKNFNTSNIYVPIHVGGEYKWKKVSVFLDLGPHVLFNVGSGDMENLETNAVAFGAGFDLGVRFKRFAVSLGFDKEFTKLATFRPDYDQQKKYELEKDKYNLKTGMVNLNLRWTLDKL